jgi:hypothetical protein
MIYVPDFLPCVLFRTAFYRPTENRKVSWKLVWLTEFNVMEWKHDFLLTVTHVLCVPSEIRSRFPAMCNCSSALKMEAPAFYETLVAVHQNYMASLFRVSCFWQLLESLGHHIRNYFVFVGVRYRKEAWRDIIMRRACYDFFNFRILIILYLQFILFSVRRYF